jgi:hypothetical protein
MFSKLETLEQRWAEQHRKMVALNKFHRDMDEAELWETLELYHRRIEYLDQLKEETDFELGFAIESVCRIEMLLAGHQEFASSSNPCVCIWCRTGSNQFTGLRA